ncbi:DUF3857 and transglutaminase domain-containing protein [candidate division KSB1 bacterium]|nr:DUF3857 and transglutaminase domain-containing protein [candidate division KSB1 bacterium]NIR73308.1 DUF3857 and transglutaminase domain-containing protein [candidate division KSB1 bacterium]NIS27014.1 DUF3857 and transglutaminase domain-containing protein [candidate division KSB1 bacterium]NIT73854.1 DUF3857 and transglutaminase domain-containing protein [candidate division KSB1 bacterium]NIU27759.1 DUF3857 and transglutaminase domain-containing protein [candidate division KSB1 bacterium]
MKNIFLQTILFVSFLVADTAIANDLPKFGKISKEELRMMSYPDLPDANALILFDHGEMRITDDFMMILKRHVRMKVLTEEGKSIVSQVRIPYWHEDKVDDIKAHSVLQNGKKVELDDDDIHTKKSDEFHEKVFAIPGVELGAVVEYEYRFRTEHLTYLQPWFFQNRIFTKLSRLSITLPPEYGYQIFFRNMPETQPEIEELLRPGRKLRIFTWQVEDISPLPQNQPYVRAWRDNLAQMHFQITRYYNPRFNIDVRFSQTLPELVMRFWDYYKGFIKEDNSFKTLLADVLPDGASEIEKIVELYDYVRKNVVTTSEGYLYPERKPEKVLKELRGTGVDKNFLLINLLEAAGFHAKPLVISTWDHGKINTRQAYLRQFNYVLVYVPVENKPYVFDTRDSYCPSNMLPEDDLVEMGLVIDDGDGQFVNIPRPDVSNTVDCKTRATITVNGELISHSIAEFEGYLALHIRAAIRKFGEEEFVKDWLKDRFGEVQIDSFKVVGLNKFDEPLHISVVYRASDYAQMAGNLMTFKAPTLNSIEKNPFQDANRYFPVEFKYDARVNDQVSIAVPDSFQVELPDYLNRSLDGMRFFNWYTRGDNIEAQRDFERSKLVFSTTDYEDLKKFYDGVMRADKAVIVMTK